MKPGRTVKEDLRAILTNESYGSVVRSSWVVARGPVWGLVWGSVWGSWRNFGQYAVEERLRNNETG